jgi:hypothetical protein
MRSFVLLLTLLLSSCTGEVRKEELSDEFVLIEFASKLEEDYERLDKTNSKEKK